MSAFGTAAHDALLAAAEHALGADDALAECLALCESRPRPEPEPLRTLHHFACSGGTLISKCIAALPNVQLLSEVDPLSTHQGPPKARFAPTDIVTLLHQSARGARPGLVAELFAEQMRVLQRDAVRQGLRLVVRDHAHSHFCHGATLAERPNLRQLMPAGVPLRSLVTVRHPLDSFASLARLGWLHFEPPTLDGYCRRYHAFLDGYAGVPVSRYEDFVAAPQPAMQRICQALDLRHDPAFVDRFRLFTLSGDSGRSGEAIAARPSHAEAVALEGEAARSAAYRDLVARLGYGMGAGEAAG